MAAALDTARPPTCGQPVRFSVWLLKATDPIYVCERHSEQARREWPVCTVRPAPTDGARGRVSITSGCQFPL